MLIYHTDESIKEIINAFTPSLMFTNLALFMHNRNIHDNVFYSFVYKHKPMVKIIEQKKYKIVCSENVNFI